MRQADRHTRGLAPIHVIEGIAIAAKPTNQHPVRDVIALMKLITLTAGIEDRMDLAIIAAREQETQLFAGVVVIAKTLHGTGGETHERHR